MPIEAAGVSSRDSQQPGTARHGAHAQERVIAVTGALGTRECKGD